MNRDKRQKKKTFRSVGLMATAAGIWSLRGVEKVLNRLPEVLKASEILIVEGEKDAGILAALTALKWRAGNDF